jgi:hypothetical protein
VGAAGTDQQTFTHNIRLAYCCDFPSERSVTPINWPICALTPPLPDG